MRQRIRFSMLFMAIVAVLSLGASTATAQLPWNPPCPNTRIINYTQCLIVLQLRTVPATGPITIPPCGSVPWAPPAGLVIHGVITQAGNFRALMFPGPFAPTFSPCGPPTPPYTTPANAWVRGVVFGPAPGCCVDVYFYRNGDPNYPCTIAIFPSAGPCTP